METHRGRTEEPAAVSWTTTDKFSLSLHQLLPFGAMGSRPQAPGRSGSRPPGCVACVSTVGSGRMNSLWVVCGWDESLRPALWDPLGRLGQAGWGPRGPLLLRCRARPASVNGTTPTLQCLLSRVCQPLSLPWEQGSHGEAVGQWAGQSRGRSQKLLDMPRARRAAKVGGIWGGEGREDTAAPMACLSDSPGTQAGGGGPPPGAAPERV